MPKNVLIIGAVALGPKAACRLKRLEPDSNIIMVDQSNLISYGGCGIPYFISGDVSDAEQLQETNFLPYLSYPIETIHWFYRRKL